MNERFAIPAIGAIVERTINGKKHIIIQERWKENGDETNGLYELPAGKIREYEEKKRQNAEEEIQKEISKIRILGL